MPITNHPKKHAKNDRHRIHHYLSLLLFSFVSHHHSSSFYFWKNIYNKTKNVVMDVGTGSDILGVWDAKAGSKGVYAGKLSAKQQIKRFIYEFFLHEVLKCLLVCFIRVLVEE